MKVDLKKAIKHAIQTEKDAMDFYTFAAKKTVDERAHNTFIILGNEERQHALTFYQAYPGDDLPEFDSMMTAAPDTDSSWWKALQRAMLNDFDERLALELAIEQEDALEKELRDMAAQIDDEHIKAVYLANASSTHHHKEVVEEDYRAMLGQSH